MILAHEIDHHVHAVFAVVDLEDGEAVEPEIALKDVGELIVDFFFAVHALQVVAEDRESGHVLEGVGNLFQRGQGRVIAADVEHLGEQVADARDEDAPQAHHGVHRVAHLDQFVAVTQGVNRAMHTLAVFWNKDAGVAQGRGYGFRSGLQIADEGRIFIDRAFLIAAFEHVQAVHRIGLETFAEISGIGGYDDAFQAAEKVLDAFDVQIEHQPQGQGAAEIDEREDGRLVLGVGDVGPGVVKDEHPADVLSLVVVQGQEAVEDVLARFGQFLLAQFLGQ